MKNCLPNILAMFMPSFIPSSRPTSYRALQIIVPKFIILRTTSPQPDSLAFAKPISLTNYKEFPLTLSKIMAVAMTFALTLTWPWPWHCHDHVYDSKHGMVMAIAWHAQSHSHKITHGHDMSMTIAKNVGDCSSDTQSSETLLSARWPCRVPLRTSYKRPAALCISMGESRISGP